MFDFINEEKGLFTFYREQAEIEQKLKETPPEPKRKSKPTPKINIRNSLTERPTLPPLQSQVEKMKKYHSIQFQPTMVHKKSQLLPLQKQLLKPKQISSMDVFQPKKQQENYQHFKRKEFQKITRPKPQHKFPFIYESMPKHPKLEIQKRSKEIISNYKPKDILENNKKFSIGSQMKMKTNFIMNGQSDVDDSLRRNEEIMLELLERYKFNK